MHVALPLSVEVREVGAQHPAREQDPGVADDVLAGPADEASLGRGERGVRHEQDGQQGDEEGDRLVPADRLDEMRDELRLHEGGGHAEDPEQHPARQEPGLGTGQLRDEAARRGGGGHDCSVRSARTNRLMWTGLWAAVNGPPDQSPWRLTRSSPASAA